MALNNIENIITLIRAAADAGEARKGLKETDWPAADVAEFIEIIDDPEHDVIDGKYRLSDAQARAILELRLQRLTGMERSKLVDETKELSEQINYYLTILQSRDKLIQVVKEELLEAKENFADDRRTVLEENEFEHDIEDLIQREDMVITVSLKGYIKRVPFDIQGAT